MSKVVFTLELEQELRDSFLAQAAADGLSAAQIVEELMRVFVKQRIQQRQSKQEPGGAGAPKA